MTNNNGETTIADKKNPIVEFEKLPDADKVRVLEAMGIAAQLMKTAKIRGASPEDIIKAGQQGVTALRESYHQKLALALAKHKVAGVANPSPGSERERVF
jgi:hypothetical protein